MGNRVSHVPDNEITHAMAHYLFTIHRLKEIKGYARVTDIAKEMGLNKSSVSVSLANLRKKELIIEDENKFVSLSEQGHQLVHKVLSSRALLYYFLKDYIGVSEEIAYKDSCLMEHIISDETREKFFLLMKNNESGLNLNKFDNYEEFTSIENNALSNEIEHLEYQDKLSKYNEYIIGKSE